MLIDVTIDIPNDSVTLIGWPLSWRHRVYRLAFMTRDDASHRLTICDLGTSSDFPYMSSEEVMLITDEHIGLIIEELRTLALQGLHADSNFVWQQRELHVDIEDGLTLEILFDQFPDLLMIGHYIHAFSLLLTEKFDDAVHGFK